MDIYFCNDDKVIFKKKTSLQKMEVLQIFDSWDQKIDSLITNHEPLTPTLLVCFFFSDFGIAPSSDTSP